MGYDEEMLENRTVSASHYGSDSKRTDVTSFAGPFIGDDGMRAMASAFIA